MVLIGLMIFIIMMTLLNIDSNLVEQNKLIDKHFRHIEKILSDSKLPNSN